jgi:hypothetical protein
MTADRAEGPRTADEVTAAWIREAYGDDYPRDIFGRLLPGAWESIPEPLKSHYQQLAKVAQAAFNYVFSPDGVHLDRDRLRLLRDEVLRLRKLERRIHDEEIFQ